MQQDFTRWLHDLLRVFLRTKNSREMGEGRKDKAREFAPCCGASPWLMSIPQSPLHPISIQQFLSMSADYPLKNVYHFIRVLWQGTFLDLAVIFLRRPLKKPLHGLPLLASLPLLTFGRWRRPLSSMIHSVFMPHHRMP